MPSLEILRIKLFTPCSSQHFSFSLSYFDVKWVKTENDLWGVNHSNIKRTRFLRFQWVCVCVLVFLFLCLALSLILIIPVHIFYRQLGCLAFCLIFWPKIKQFLSNCPALDWTFRWFLHNRVKINYETQQPLWANSTIPNSTSLGKMISSNISPNWRAV